MTQEKLEKIQDDLIKCQNEINAILEKYNMALTIAQNIQLSPKPPVAPKSNIIK